MATVADLRGREFKVIPMQTVRQMQPLTAMRPVILMPLHPPQRDYLFLSIASLLFFIPLAIPALIFSLKTRKANVLGNQEKAQIYSRLAFGFSVSSILVSITVIVCSIVIKLLKQDM